LLCSACPCCLQQPPLLPLPLLVCLPFSLALLLLAGRCPSQIQGGSDRACGNGKNSNKV
jgi:hypothetical protein